MRNKLVEQARYGEMTTLSVGTKTWVLLNSSRVANEIIAKRAAITHERPYFPVAGAVTGISIFMASTKATSSPSLTLAPTSAGSAQTRPATSVTILMSGIYLSGTAAARDRTARIFRDGRPGFQLWPQIA